MGRLPKAEAADRRADVLAAARAEIERSGYERTTMLAVARRCGASKETLYTWFGSKQGLFAELIAGEGARAAAAVAHVLADGDPRAGLRRFARALLDLLTGPWSLAVNRAAMGAPELAALVLTHGRHAVGPVVERALADLDARGVLDAPDPAAAFAQLYGLVVQDVQIRALLGEEPPPAAQRHRRADAAVDAFWRLRERA